MIATGQRSGATHHEGQTSDIAGERHRVRASGGFHAGNDTKFFHDRIMRPDLLVQLRIARPRERQLQRHQPHRIESGIGRAKIKKTFDQKACPRQ
jgi:hypothetical protein